MAALHDGGAHTQVLKRLREPQNDERDPRDAEVRGRQEPREQDGDHEPREGANECAREPPLRRLRRAVAQAPDHGIAALHGDRG